MATIRKLRGKYQAIIRRRGFPHTSRTFTRKSDAVHWVRLQEQQLEASAYGGLPLSRLEDTSLSDLLTRYQSEISPKKRGGEVEKLVLSAIAKRRVGRFAIANLSPEALCGYRDERLSQVKPATVNKELSLIQHCLQVAQRQWGFPLLTNPVKMIDKPKIPSGRERRLAEGEFDALIRAARTARNKYLEPLIRLAIETGMRQGELLTLRWENLDLHKRTAFLPLTKNGHYRTVPLSSEALEVIQRLPRTSPRLFPITSEAAKRAWMRIRLRAGSPDLRFHDLRHEATSRFFERGLNIPEVALITGHKDGRMLFRYTHLKAENVAIKLATPASGAKEPLT